MMSRTVTIIDVGPGHVGMQDIIIASEMKRRGVRFLPMQARKRVSRSASKGGFVNPFTPQ